MPVMPIERGKIREYARAAAADWPAYVDALRPPVPPTFLGEESIRRFRTRFRKVVQRGEVLTGSAVVTRVFEQDGEARAELALTLTDAPGRRRDRRRR